MAATVSRQAIPANARTSPLGSINDNVNQSHNERPRQASATESVDNSAPPQSHNAGSSSRKAKGKKGADPINTSKLVEDTIAQLERSQAGEKDQELEIERDVKKANRDLSNLLSTIQSPMARIESVQKKYAELFAEMKRTEREHIKFKKRADQLQKEKDVNRSELSKTTTVKEKLEKLCRELQKENKKLKDDNRRLCDTETRMREDLHGRLENMVEDVQAVIDQKENPGNVPANLEADELFRQKFKSFIDQYELRELQFQSLLRTKELEVQYQNARYEQQRKAQEQEASKSRQLTTQVSTFSQTETALRSQLNIYVEKFKQVEDTLNNSNDLFLTFRKEMEEMSKKTKRLEKENHNLTRKHNLTNSNILQMAEERTKTTKELETLRKRNDDLEKLCRGMQAQGRGQAIMAPPSASAPAQGKQASHGGNRGGTAEGEYEGITEESEYDYEDEDEESYDDEEEDEEEDDEDVEDEDATDENIQKAHSLPTYGPPPPPPPTEAALVGKYINGHVNGIKH